MDIEKLIKETFDAYEHVTPDGDRVLAAARRRIDRRRAVLGKPLGVAAGVVALTLAAVAVVGLNRPADQAPVAAPGSETTSPAPAEKPGLPMPYSLDWLPPGDIEYLVHRINIGATAANPDVPLFGGEYMFTVTNGGQVLYVDVQQFKMSPVDDAAFKSGPGSPVTINGQRGVESAVADGPGGYELYVAHPDGGSMYVGVSAEHGSTAPAQLLIDTGRQIAQGIRFPGTTTVAPVFALRDDLPNGLRICAFDVEKGRGPFADGSTGPTTSYSLGDCTVMPPVQVSTGDADHVTGTPGKPVQDHETRYVDEDGYVRLWVLDAVDGAPVTVAGRVPLADLYAVADRLVL